MGCLHSVLKKDADLEEKYELLKLVGQGVEGEVWLAKATETDEHVAIKLVER